MIARLLLRVLLLVALPVHFSYATEVFVPEVWTARGAIEFALRSNPDSQIARQRLREAEALQTRAAAGFYPQLDLSGAYSQTDNPMHSFGNILNQGAFTPAIDFNDPGRTDNLNLSATVQYRFYNGGQDRARSQAAAAGFDVATAEHEAILRRLEFEVFRSFQQIDEADNINRARLAALDAIRSSLAVARSRYDAGDLLKIDLLNLEVQESQAEENQIQSAHRLELAKKIFLQLLGLDAGEVRIDSAGMETPARPEPPGPVQRPELLQLRAATRAADAQLRAARGSRLPTVDGFAAYQYDQGTVYDGQGDSWLAGVKVNFKLFDGHMATADIALGEARLAALHAEQRKLELAIALEINQAELALSLAEQRQQVTQKMVEQATESAQLSRARFNEGVILSSDLIDTEARLTDARVRNTTAISALRLAVADLRRASGLSQFEATLQPSPPLEENP